MIAGAASGIGAALAERLAAAGARLLLSDISSTALQQVADRLGATPFMADVSHPDDVERLADAAGGTRLVCLNAGVTSTATGPVWEAPPEEWWRVIDINLGGVVNGLRSFVPRLLAAGEQAHVLITASLAGLATWPGGGPYAASKHAVVTVAEQAALALADSPIHITVLCPALVRSGMSEVGDDPLHVADEALAALKDRRFIAAPAQWHQAIRERAERLALGLAPAVREPN